MIAQIGVYDLARILLGAIGEDGAETADEDVTGLVRFGDNDGEALSLTRCVCGAEFDWWDMVLSIYRDDARECPHCGRRLYFTNAIQVFEVANQ